MVAPDSHQRNNYSNLADESFPHLQANVRNKDGCRDSLRHRANASSAAAHLAFMFLRMICIGVNGVPIFFA